MIRITGLNTLDTFILLKLAFLGLRTMRKASMI
jgi:hypothetical protein